MDDESDSQGPIVGLDQTALLSAIVDSSTDAIISKRLDGVVLTWNAAAERLFGWAPGEIIGQSVRRLIPDNRQSEEDELIRRIERGENIKSFETVRQRKDGTLVDISVTISPVRDPSGRIFGASKIARDITERKAAEQQISLLVKELHHRSRNLLAVVQAVASLTAARSPGDFLPRFVERLQAIARNHDLLVRNAWYSADIGDLVETNLAPFVDLFGTQIVFGGPTLTLTPKAVQNLGLALHELQTNAVKYGALSALGGTIAIGWRVEGEEFAFEWTEKTAGVAVAAGAAGFGSTVLQTIAGPALGGSAELEIVPGGLRWNLRAPICGTLVSP